MSRYDELMKLSYKIQDAVMEICEEAMGDDNELDVVGRKMQLYFEEVVELRYGGKSHAY